MNIGITGGIGSGKTTVCKIFELLGIPVYYADDRAKDLMVNDKDIVKKITALFGEKAYTDSGELDRPFIAQIVFNDRSILDQLNAIVHPAVAIDSLNWSKRQKAPYTIKEAALLFEGGSYKQLDKVIMVFAPKTLRMERVMKRDQSDQKSIEARMDKQMPEGKKMELTNFIINNNGEQLLLPQILNIHQAILALKDKQK